MKKTFFSAVLAAALTLSGAGVALAAPQHGEHGGVHGGVQAMPRAGAPAMRGGAVQRNNFQGEFHGRAHFDNHHHGHGGVIVAPFGGWYDPFWGGYYGDPYYYGGYYAAPYSGGIRLDVKPSEGQVFVDGSYAGQVSEFNGVFQSLDL